jgi:hypothetical protein
MKVSRQIRLTILNLMDDPQVFGPWFRGSSWRAWRIFLTVLFGLPLSSTAQETYTTHTGRQQPPTGQASEAWLVVDRRGGKSLIAPWSPSSWPAFATTRRSWRRVSAGP